MKRKSGRHARASQLDIRCSTACTRAGLTILVFSSLAFALLQPLERVIRLDAFGKYLTLRANLSIALDEIQKDRCWRGLVRDTLGRDAFHKLRLATLLEYTCSSRPLTNRQRTEPKKKTRKQDKGGVTSNKDASQQSKIPGKAPTGTISISRIFPIPHLHTIVDTLVKLADRDLLSRARSVYADYDISIYRWQLFTDRVFEEKRENATDNIYMLKDGNLSFSREWLINNFTLAEAKELADYEYPDFERVVELFQNIGRVTLPFIQQPIKHLFAAIFIELGLLFSVIYFWLFQKEAGYSKSFPAPGTLFGVFYRTLLSRTIFRVLAVLVACSSAFLAYYSWPLSKLNIIPSGLVVLLSALIAMRLSKPRSGTKRQSQGLPSRIWSMLQRKT